MGKRIAIGGNPNSGKSYSRSFLTNPNEHFLITPSQKHSYLKDAKPFKVLINGKRSDELAMQNETSSAAIIADAIKAAIARKWDSGAPKITNPEGNYLVCNQAKDVLPIIKYINRFMPHIKTCHIGDFTHFISNTLSSDEFIKRKAGGDAYLKYLELASDLLRNIITASDSVREDLNLVIEFHLDYDEQTGFYGVFVPGGKMLTEKFLPESYFDMFLFAEVLPFQEGIKDEDRYKFVCIKREPFDGRGMNLFGDVMDSFGRIPNDMQLVLDRVLDKVPKN